MPRSSRSKSHKQSKHSSREYSDLDEDINMKETNDNTDGKKNGGSVKVSLVSGEKRTMHVNGNVSDEFSRPSKRRREKIHDGSDRWNDDDGEDKSEVVNIDDNNLKSNDLLKAVGVPKRKTSRKYDVDKESGRKEGHQIRENKSEREKKIHDGKHEVEVLPMQVENQPRKRGREHNEWPIEEEMRNIELEKELEKRMKRREGYNAKDIKHKDETYKYRENKHRAISEKDNKRKGEINRKRDDKYCEDGNNRDCNHKEERYRDDIERDHRHKTGWARDDTDRKKRSRDHSSDFESKNLKEDSHRHANNHGGSPIYDDWVARNKDYKDTRRDNDNNTNNNKDAKIDPIFERGRSSSRNGDMEITANHSRHRSSSDAKYYRSRDHHRISKQEETKYGDYVHEERACHNVDSNRDLSDKICTNDLLAGKRLKLDSRSSLSSTSKISSHLPPQPPFKTGLDSPLGFGSSEDDRGNLNNCNWKSVDPNVGRTQTSWNNFSNWPYMPYHHVPSPILNPIMQQFMPPMNMNHAAMPYHVPVDGSHGYGNWDHVRTQLHNQLWESNVDLQSFAQKNDDSVHGPTDEIWSGQTGPHIENEESKMDFNTPEVMKVTESSRAGKDDGTLISRVYLSKIDVSKDLTRPELYEQCTSMLLDLDQAPSVSDEFDCKILFLEEGVEADITNGASLFPAIDNSVFKKAISLYTKHKVHFTATNLEGVLNGTQSVGNQEKENEEPTIQNLDMDPMNEDIKVDYPVKNPQKVSCAPSVGGCEGKVKVKVKDFCNNYDVSTSDLIEFGLVNLSRMHSPESTH